MAQINRGKSRLDERKSSTTGTEKKSVAQPATLQDFIVVLAMHLCKKVLLIKTGWKIGFYLALASVGSLVTDLIPVPKSYFSDKTNFFNVVFVKMGWGWTLSILLPFVYFTSTTYCCATKNLVRQHMARLGIATFFWFACTKSFNWIEHVTGMCSSVDMEHNSKATCVDAGYNWVGFDISGHTFLLMHCLLVISEEVKCINGWSKIPEMIKNEEEKPMRLSKKQLSTLKSLYDTYTPKIKGLTIAMTFLQLIWEVMLISTILYFHNMPQKIAAALSACAVWFFTYNSWYKIDNLWPTYPGKGLFRYMITQ